MRKILSKLWPSRNRRKYDRVSVHSIVKFKILDSRNPGVCSRMLSGEILDISEEGLCIGTNTVQIDGLHIFHHPSRGKSKLELEVDLQPGQAPLKTIGEVRWYRRIASESASTYKVGVTWDTLSRDDQEALRKLLKEIGRNPA
jgi:hypothetical protein